MIEIWYKYINWEYAVMAEIGFKIVKSSFEYVNFTESSC